MSRALLVAPHADDETLFAAYLVQRYDAFVVCVYDEGRAGEFMAAARMLGVGAAQMSAQKGESEEGIESHLWGLAESLSEVLTGPIIVPAERIAGHEEHNIVARCCERVFEGHRLIRYLTYAPRGQRDRDGNPSEPDHPDCITKKLAAMSCYASQTLDPSTRPWFYELLDMREWTA